MHYVHRPHVYMEFFCPDWEFRINSQLSVVVTRSGKQLTSVHRAT